MRPGEMWKHERCSDVQIYINAIVKEAPSYIKLRVTYFLTSGHPLDCTETVKIQRDQMGMWKRVEV